MATRLAIKITSAWAGFQYTITIYPHIRSADGEKRYQHQMESFLREDKDMWKQVANK